MIARKLPRIHSMLLGYEYPIQMRKELLLCNTENRVNLFPFFWARLTFFSCFEVGSPNISVTHSFVLLYIGSSLCSSLLPVPTVPCLRSRGLQHCNRKTGYAFAPTQTSSVRQRTCSSLSLSSRLPV